MAIKNWNQLESALQRIVDNTMAKDVSPMANKQVKVRVKKDVYDAYHSNSPDRYIRTGELLDSTGAKYIGRRIEISSSRTDSGSWGSRNVSNVIETGRGYVWGKLDGRDLEAKIGRRPFMANTREEMESGLFKETLKNGLIQRGLNIK